MLLEDCKSVDDVVEYLYKVAKARDLFLKEIRLEDNWLCYAMFSYVSDDEIMKQKQEKMWPGMILETRLNKRDRQNREPHIGKINLCKYVNPFKDRIDSFRKKEYMETGVYPKR